MSASTRRALVVLAVAALLVPLVPGALGRGLLQCAVEVGAVVVAWQHLARRPQALRDGWGLLGVATTLLAMSDVITTVAEQVGHWDGGPMISSVLALAGYVLVGAAGVRLERRRSRVHRTSGSIETVIFATGVLTPVLVFLVVPIAQEASLTNGARALALVYAVADLVVVAVIARLMLTEGSQSRSVSFLSAALATSLAGDLWNWLESGQVNTPDDPVVRMLWALSFVLFAAGIAHPSMVGLASAQDGPRDVPRSRRVWLMGLGQSMPALTLLVALLVGRTPSLPVIAVGGLLVSVLVTARMNGLLDRIGTQSSRLAAMARLDDLTGLCNRRAWNDEFARACTAASLSARPLSIALMDLDHFKGYNDTYGHPAGDRLLRLAAQNWGSAMRPGEVLARYGGEEFAVLLPDHGVQEAVARLDAMRPLTPGGQTFSAGVAQWEASGDTEQTMTDADSALYAAKRSGRDRVLGFDPRAREIAALPHALRTVVQPIVRTRDLTVVAYEALSRFDPAPDVQAVFDQAHAEGYGDVLESSAILSALRLPARPQEVRVFVNVSERAMRSSWFWQAVPQSLEHVVMELHEQRDGLDDLVLAELLDRFRSRGAEICLDDLTATDADLQRVLALAPDVVKVDRSLVAGCDDRPDQVVAMRRLLAVAEVCGAQVCAEGVETLAELQVLRDLAVPLLQGYLLGRPEPHWVEPLEPALRVRETGVAQAREVTGTTTG